MAEEQAQGGGAATTLGESSLLDQILAEAKVTPDQETYSIAIRGSCMVTTMALSAAKAAGKSYSSAP